MHLLPTLLDPYPGSPYGSLLCISHPVRPTWSYWILTSDDPVLQSHTHPSYHLKEPQGVEGDPWEPGSHRVRTEDGVPCSHPTSPVGLFALPLGSMIPASTTKIISR